MTRTDPGSMRNSDQKSGPSKRVCFVSTPEVLDIVDDNFDSYTKRGGDEENDLDLDTFGRTSQKSRRLKEGIYSESEAEEFLDEEDDDIGGKDKVIPPPKLDTSSGEEELEEDQVFDQEEEEEIKLEPFNMKAEKEEGRFDDDENYIRNIDEEEHQDSWLQGISKKDIQLAREAESKRQERLQQESQKSELSVRDLVEALKTFLMPGESVMQAIQRRNLGLTRRRVGQKLSKVQLSEEQVRAEAQKRAEIERITEIATKLLTCGMTLIYDETLESLKI